MAVARDHFVYAPSQLEMMLQRNIIFHWLGAYTRLWPWIILCMRPAYETQDNNDTPPLIGWLDT